MVGILRHLRELFCSHLSDWIFLFDAFIGRDYYALCFFDRVASLRLDFSVRCIRSSRQVTEPEYGCGPSRRFSSGLLALRLALSFFWPLLALRFFWLSGLPLARTLLSSLDHLFLCVLWSRSPFCLVGLAPFLWKLLLV